MKVKLTDWNIQDYLKTPEEQLAYIEAAAEENTPDAIPDAFADVFRALGMESEATACEGLANYLRAMPTTTARRKAARFGRCGMSTDDDRVKGRWRPEPPPGPPNQ